MRDQVPASNPLGERRDGSVRSIDGDILRGRKPQLDPQSGRVIEHFNLRLVEVGHRRNQAQAEAAARAVPAVLEPVEAL